MLATQQDEIRFGRLSENNENEPYSYVKNTAFRNPVGYIGVLKLDTGVTLVNDIIPFDIIAVITYGSAEIIINNESIALKVGDIFIIPEHSANSIRVHEDIKMIFTIFKNQ